MTRRDDLTALVARACERFGKLDVLVSNAGIGPISAQDDLRVDEWGHGGPLRVTLITAGCVRTDFVEPVATPVFRAQMVEVRDKLARAPEAIARGGLRHRTAGRFRCRPDRRTACRPNVNAVV